MNHIIQSLIYSQFIGRDEDRKILGVVPNDSEQKVEKRMEKCEELFDDDLSEKNIDEFLAEMHKEEVNIANEKQKIDVTLLNPVVSSKVDTLDDPVDPSTATEECQAVDNPVKVNEKSDDQIAGPSTIMTPKIEPISFVRESVPALSEEIPEVISVSSSGEESR